MKVTLKLYAGLASYLPAEARNHAVEVEAPPGTTPNELIESRNVPRQMAHLVLLNGIYLPPEERDKPLIRDRDTLAVWPPVAGG